MKRNYLWPFPAGLILGLIGGAYLTLWLDDSEQHPGAEELKLSVHNLKNLDGNDSPQLREYLKGRVYTLVATGIDSQWVDDNIDYGPLDRQILRHLSVVKGPDSDDDLYLGAIAAAEGRAKKGKTKDSP